MSAFFIFQSNANCIVRLKKSERKIISPLPGRKWGLDLFATIMALLWSSFEPYRGDIMVGKKRDRTQPHQGRYYK